MKLRNYCKGNFEFMILSFLIVTAGFQLLNGIGQISSSSSLTTNSDNPFVNDILKDDSHQIPFEPTSAIQENDDWTIMVVINGDDSIEHAVLDAIQELESGLITEKGVEVIAFVDRHPDYDSSNGNWSNGRYYRVIHDVDTRLISSEVLLELDEPNMGQPSTLRNFVDWTMQNYPANNYAMMLLMHGLGLTGLNFDSSHLIPGTQYQDFLTLNEFQIAMDGIHLDVLSFDSCLMGMIEAVYEFRTIADYIIVSEQIGMAEGLDYDTIVNTLSSNPSMKALEFAKLIAETVIHPEWELFITRSVINSSQLETLVNELSTLSNLLMANLSSNIDRLQNIRMKTYDIYDKIGHISYEDMADLGSFLSLLKQNFSDIPAILEATNKALEAYNSAILYNFVDEYSKPATGLTICFPIDIQSFRGFAWDTYLTPTSMLDFHEMDFLKDSNWDEFLIQYLTKASIIEQESPNYIPATVYNSYNINLFEDDDIISYVFEVNVDGIYNISLDVKMGDMSIIVFSQNDLLRVPYLISDGVNPEQRTNEQIVYKLKPDWYLIMISSWNGTSSGTFQIEEIQYKELQLGELIQGSFPPRRGTIRPIVTLYHYYSITLEKGKYKIEFNVSDHVLAEFEIRKLVDKTLIVPAFKGNEGEDFFLEFEIIDQQILLIEFGPYEWTGDYELRIIKSSDIETQDTDQTEQTVETQNTNKTGNLSIFSSIMIFVLVYIQSRNRSIYRFDNFGDNENGIL